MSRALSAVSSLRLTLARGSLLLLALLLSVPSALADINILLNGELIEGTGNRPDHWRTESLAHDARTFSWVRKPGGPSELRITNARPDFAQWVQTVRLSRLVFPKRRDANRGRRSANRQRDDRRLRPWPRVCIVSKHAHVVGFHCRRSILQGRRPWLQR